MTRSKRLEPIVAYKERQQKQCLQDVAQSKKKLEQQQTQLESLLLYQLEYHQKTTTPDQPILSAMQHLEHRRFLDQLEQTINQQRLVIEDAQKEFEFKQKYWLKIKNNAQAVENLVDNLHQQELKQEDQLEQKISDEFGLRIKNK